MTSSSEPRDPQRSYFAEAGRTSHDELAAQLRRTLDDPCVKVVLETITGFVMVLNEHRQILAANQELMDALSMHDPSGIIGIRPGEAFNCVHFTEGPDGCGTSKHCRTCGAVLATLASRTSDHPVEDECRLSMLRDGKLQALDLRVRATGLHMNGTSLTALVMHDISAIKRREALEETFLHDFLNTIGGIEAWSKILEQSDAGTAAREIVELSARLKEEVLAQRTLLEAEKGELKPHPSVCDAESIFERLRLLFEHNPVAHERRLKVTNSAAEVRFSADRSLLMRVLVNMIKNAFEATATGGEVRMRFEMSEGRPTFCVHNSGVMSEDVAARIFERSFSTRAGHGRGLGTYSMMLYGERYLRGKVSFTSNAGEGTVFRISLPTSCVTVATGTGSATAILDKTNGHGTKKRRLLLVDDDEALLRLGSLLLAQLGFEVVGCRSAEEALGRFAEMPDAFAGVITDLSMAHMNGLEFSRRVNSIREVPVVLCTGFGEITDINDVSGAGISSILSKPFTFQDFARVINEALNPDD